MLAMACEDVRIVQESLGGTRAMDEQTFASAAVLVERLARLKRVAPALAEVSLSPHMEALVLEAVTAR